MRTDSTARRTPIDEREFFEGLVYHSSQGRRFTQQSPVMPDVWIHYGMNPGQRLDLLMEPDWHYTPAQLADMLAARLRLDEGKKKRLDRFRLKDAGGPQIACNQNVVAVRLWFDQLIRGVLPMSGWWMRSVARLEGDESDVDLADDLQKRLAAGTLEKDLALALASNRSGHLANEVIWLARLAGLIAHISTPAARRTLENKRSPAARVHHLTQLVTKHQLIANAFVTMLATMDEMQPGDDLPLYSVNRNRETLASVHASVNAIKADAARVVFTTRGKNVAWAVVDSGIDATHLAFRQFRMEAGEAVPHDQPFPAAPARRRALGNQKRPASNNTRVVASYDFVHIRELLGAQPEEVDALDQKKFPALKDKSLRDRLKELLKEQDRFTIDWERFEPFIRIEHQDGKYREPVNRHGTHVAGIIGADWRMQKGEVDGNPSIGMDMVGVAPDIRLYDLRVLDHDGRGTEFAIMSALQFIRDLNNRRNFMAIQGVNLSFSIQHDVANYACGRTPVCEEAERLVASGVVVVAAAGNSGRARYVTPSGVDDEGFRTVSITDPGNAAGVITVGATHRSDPHTYGVSYFSSRGPTGDGRLKPDLVAPGEKIRSTVPANGDALLDGTSMAAPHVSGAAALLISRYPEFIGQPLRVKEILCKSATDLGRERYFQGAGLLDILRALQSI
jgi:subtilisin family serine protease